MSTVTDRPIRERISDSLTRERFVLELGRARGPFGWWLLLLAGALTAFVLLLTELHLPAPWASQYAFRVAARDVTGVQPGDQVRIAGVQVGHVTSVALRDGTPVVSATIAPRYGPLYRDARVEIRPNTPLQDMYLNIVSRGTPGAGRVAGGGVLAAAQTDTPVQFGQVIDIFDAAVRPRVTASIDALGAGLGDHGEDLRRALVELAPFLRVAQGLSSEIAARGSETRRLVHNFALLQSELAGRTADLTGLVRAGAVTMNRLASVGGPLGDTIAQLPPTLAELPRSFAAVDAAADQVDPAVRALLPVADRLAPALGALQRVSPVASRALAGLDRPLPGLTALFRRATPVADHVSESFSLLRPQAPQLDRATARITPCEPAVKDFFQWTLSVSKLWGVVGDMQRGIAIEGSSAATDMVAPSSAGDRAILTIAPTCAPTDAAIK